MASVSGLTNTIIGAGMLALPHAYAKMGWLLGTVLLLLCAAVTNFGLYLVKLSEARLQNRAQSFYDLTTQAMPSAVWCFDATIFIKCFGVAVSYLVICGHLLPQVVSSFAMVLFDDTVQIPKLLLSKALWVMAALAIVSPACFYRKLYQMRIIGYLNMAAVVYLLVIMLYYFLSSTARSSLSPPGEISAVIVSKDLLTSLPIMLFAYTCAQNILPVYYELRDSTVERCSIVTIVSIGSSAMVYVIVALIGYATFGANVSDNIIAMYPASSLFVCIGKLSVIALTLSSFPMQLYPCRASLINLLEYNRIVTPNSDSEEPILHSSMDQIDPVQHIELDDRRWSLITIALMSAALLVSMLTDDLSVVLGIVGSLGSTTISFILPALLYRRIFEDEVNSNMRSSAFFLGLCGGLLLVLALSVNISKLVYGA
ncbi:hypothetical protein MPSI1_001139 [Malassezia psittaci]|uniref:Amino acid transporter transmembrane domain-containing protein n=1 Tax=Malassezia psittaci TaxID=1821823 RepID=A0AAF0JDL0_9BASI|nr:hypothetical protein MPSI1_001139 [Malassezia psittaci]